MRRYESRQNDCANSIMGNLGHKLLGVVLSAVKAFFSGIVQIAWGIATFFILGALLTYYKVDTSAITTLLKLTVFIQQNWLYFFWVIAIWEFIVNLKDFLRPVYQKEQENIKTNKGVQL